MKQKTSGIKLWKRSMPPSVWFRSWGTLNIICLINILVSRNFTKIFEKNGLNFFLNELIIIVVSHQWQYLSGDFKII